MVHGPSSKVGIAEIAFAANARPDQLPAGMEPLLETTATYEPADSGACSRTALMRWHRAGHRHRALQKDCLQRAGQPLAASLSDYLVPTPAKFPSSASTIW